jgi:hypothetical protein
VDLALEQPTNSVLDVLSRARKVFGGERPPADAPAFVPPRELEDDLGRESF